MEIAEKVDETSRIHTFGIGSDFDREIVKRLANIGRGHASEITDLVNGNLAGSVVTALSRALYPSLSDCNLIWNFKDDQTKIDLGEVFYNQMISDYKIISKEQFQQLSLTFSSKEDPLTKEPFTKTYYLDDFQ